MKKTLLSLLLLFATQLLFGNVQNGLVKTRGRLTDNGSVIAGVPVAGASVVLKGGVNSTVSGNDGKFSLTVPAGKFYLHNVSKKGYSLVDIDALAKEYHASGDPLILVMESLRQIEADKMAYGRKIRRSMDAQLQAKQTEIDSLLEANRITEEQYTEALRRLNSDVEKNEKLISEMAERYARMDFDQIDGFQRRVADFILRGELSRADSLLNSKGSMEERAAEIDRLREANDKEDAELKRREENLAQSREMAAKLLEDFGADCYSRHEIANIKHDTDSAAYWLRLRADKAPENIEWQLDAGWYIRDYLANYVLALSYFQSAAKQAQKNEENELLSATYNNIGLIYANQGEHDMALEYYNKALKIQEKIFGRRHPAVATSYKNIGDVYDSLGKYYKALVYYDEALKISETTFGTEHPDVVNLYNIIGWLYANKGAIITMQKQKSHNFPNGALYSYSSLSIDKEYKPKDNKSMALEYYGKALKAQETIFGTKHPDVALTYRNIGNTYAKQGRYSKAVVALTKSLDILTACFGNENETTVDMATNLYANIHSLISQYAIDKKALRKFLFDKAFTATVVGDGAPAAAQGMSGEYFLLEFDDWNYLSDINLFEKVNALSGQPKTILVMKDGKIERHSFEDATGLRFALKPIGKEAKDNINKLYKKHK